MIRLYLFKKNSPLMKVFEAESTCSFVMDSAFNTFLFTKRRKNVAEKLGKLITRIYVHKQHADSMQSGEAVLRDTQKTFEKACAEAIKGTVRCTSVDFRTAIAEDCYGCKKLRMGKFFSVIERTADRHCDISVSDTLMFVL